MINKTLVIGVGGYARSGKDTFVNVASKILNQNGYNTQVCSFAAALKDDLDGWLKEKYGISAWTTDDEEKKLIRPFLVAHGCGKRIQTQGKYWVDKVNAQIENSPSYVKSDSNHVIFISDVRFENEAKWLHNNWNGWLVHIKKYREYFSESPIVVDGVARNDLPIRAYDSAPNDEEFKQDPLVVALADYKLELENVIEREKRNGNIITPESLTDNSYLIEEITKCLSKCPFLNIQVKSRLHCS